jgi:hypothetical protein
MYRKHLVAVAVVATMLACEAPAVAATIYYVALDANTHTCKVTKKKPKGRKSMMVGRAAYSSKAEAKSAMHAAALCSGGK